jgi:hypothetical protein
MVGNVDPQMGADERRFSKGWKKGLGKINAWV